MRLEPLYDRIIVKVLEGDDKTAAGLFVPQLARDNTPFLRGEVVATGHGRIVQGGEVVPLRVVEGDVVCFFRAANSGEQLVVPFGDAELLTIRESHVIGIFRDLPRGTGLIGETGRELVVPS